MLTMAEIMRMSKAQLRPLVAMEAKKARKRANRILKTEDLYTSPALRQARKSRPKGQAALFESRGKSLNQLRKEYKRIKNFMEDATSTVKGTRKFYEDAAKNLSAATSDNFDADSIQTVFNIFDKLEDDNAWISRARFKYEIFEAINDQISQMDSMTSTEEIINNLSGMIERMYKENIDIINSGDDWVDLNRNIDEIAEEE